MLAPGPPHTWSLISCINVAAMVDLLPSFASRVRWGVHPPHPHVVRISRSMRCAVLATPSYRLRLTFNEGMLWESPPPVVRISRSMGVVFCQVASALAGGTGCNDATLFHPLDRPKSLIQTSTSNLPSHSLCTQTRSCSRYKDHPSSSM